MCSVSIVTLGGFHSRQEEFHHLVCELTHVTWNYRSPHPTSFLSPFVGLLSDITTCSTWIISDGT